MPDETPIQLFERALRSAAGSAAPGTPTPHEVAAVWAFTGVEVALAREAVARRSLPRVWKDRRGTRATPLLVVAPSEEAGLVSVVGPTADQPIRDINPETLATEVARLRNESAIRAGRALEESLARLFDEALPGVQVRGVLTTHYVRSRLPRHKPVVYAQLAEVAAPAEGKADWRDALQALGYTLVDRGHDEYAARVGENTVALVHPHRDPSWFARIDENGRLPEGVLIAACQDANVRWGMMVSSSRIRLFEARTDRGAATDRWIDLDLATLGDSERYLLGLLAPSSLDESGVWRELIEDARTFGGELKDRLDEQIRRHALPEIARGLGEWIEREGRGSLDDPEVRRGIQQATNTLLFRLLFILYAESAGHLPIGRSEAYRDNALYTLGRRARETRDRAGSTPTLWRRLKVLVRAIREGDKGMALPQYNGSLFAADDLPGARLLEDAEVADSHLAPALEALAFDFEGDDDAGLDYTDLDIGHLGSIYEGLLALRLSRADQTYAWDKGKDRYVPSEEPGDYGVQAGQLFFQTEAGGRKGGGVYYTRQEFVRHLVNHSVLPALDEHLEQVQRLAESDPDAATRLLFRFRVLDPAMGSGHFLVDALDVIAERVQRFLAETPLPPLGGRLEDLRADAGKGAEAADDAQLLKRLLLKHCIYGVDLQEMAVELARVALWLSSFVPGLALSYLDQNLKRGDSLVGVASVEVVLASSGKRGQRAFWGEPGGPLDQAITEAGKIATEIADLADRTKAEVQRSRELRSELDARLSGVRRVFDLWTAEPFGVKGARAALLDGGEIIEGGSPTDLGALVQQAEDEAKKRLFFHWPLEFPEVFHRDVDGGSGFHAVVGNPPWETLLTHEVTFYAQHDPGLRGVRTADERQRRIDILLSRYPALERELVTTKEVTEAQRVFFRPENGYTAQGGGQVDLYELFCERYGLLGRQGGGLGVVLPRAALIGKGNRGFRRWLFTECWVQRVDVILNSGRWAFDMEPRKTVALLSSRRATPPKDASFATSGPSRSLSEFVRASGSAGVRISLEQLASWTPDPIAPEWSTWEVPLLPSARASLLFDRFRQGVRFDAWSKQRAGIFAVQGDMNETKQKRMFSAKSGTAVWKGKSFDQYAPHGEEVAGHGSWASLFAFIQNRRERSRAFRAVFPAATLRNAASHPIHRPRVAFRDVTNRTNSRTMIACLIPPQTPLVHSSPYLVFPQGDGSLQAYLLGVLNSVIFDWQARRFVEEHVYFFLLDILCVPIETHTNFEEIATRAARLSCIDERFAEFAAATGVDCSPLSKPEHARLRAEIDALVALGYGLDAADLETVFDDFTLNAVPEAYRALVREKFAEFSAVGAEPAKAGA